VITLPLLSQEIMAIRNAAFNKVLWREMLVYGLPLMVVGFAGMINETLDRIILSYLYTDVQAGLKATGIYGANYKLSILMSLFIQAFRYAAEPFFFSHSKDNDKRHIYASVMNYFTLVCLGLFLTVTLYIDVFKHFINERYWEGLHVVPILLLANMFLGIYYNLSIWYKLSDNTNKGAAISMVGAAITILVNFILIPVMGYTGSAWATFVCYFSMAVLCYVQGMKYYPIPYQVKRLSVYIVSAVLIFFVVKWISLPVNWFSHLLYAAVLIAFAAITFLSERKNKIVG
jgi:O-antigen/teichoic acid export membrane protein